MPRLFEDISSLVPIQEGQESPLPLISGGIQPDSPLPNPTTETEPKKGVIEEEVKGEKEEEEEKKVEEKEDGEKGKEEKGDESLAINYGASRVSKMATRRIRNRTTPYSSSSRSHRSVDVQTSSSNVSRSTSTSTFWNQVFVGTPKIYNLCSCKDHTCSKDKK